MTIDLGALKATAKAGTHFPTMQTWRELLALIEVAEAARASVAADNEEFGTDRSQRAFVRLEQALSRFSFEGAT